MKTLFIICLLILPGFLQAQQTSKKIPVVTIWRFPNCSEFIYQTNTGITTGADFYFHSASDFYYARFYLISDFDPAHLPALDSLGFAYLQSLYCHYEPILNARFKSQPGDLIYTIRKNEVIYRWHITPYFYER